MACYSPLKGFQIGVTDNGKPDYLITSYKADHVEIDSKGKSIVAYTKDRSPYCFTYLTEWIEIPCGKCIGCRLNYSRIWADRCMAEAKEHKSNYFVTLTYDNDNVPITEYIDNDGTYNKIMSLKKRDVQLFMKRLRKNYSYDNKIRFFLAGEYGTDTARPHYHLILFGLILDDLVLYKRTSTGFNLYNSDFLNATWKKGHVVVADVTWETCAYTARYIMKKQKGSGSKIYDDLNIEPEFTLMSRKPGIARDFYEKNKTDYLMHREVYLSTLQGGRKIKNIKYFDKLLDVEYPIYRELQKEKIIATAEVIRKEKLKNTSLNYLEMLEVQKNVKEQTLKALPRKEI